MPLQYESKITIPIYTLAKMLSRTHTLAVNAKVDTRDLRELADALKNRVCDLTIAHAQLLSDDLSHMKIALRILEESVPNEVLSELRIIRETIEALPE